MTAHLFTTWFTEYFQCTTEVLEYRMDICICMPESFDYIPETNTTFQPVNPKGNQS